MGELIEKDNINPVEMFKDNGIDEILHKIEQQVLYVVPDLSTVKGRKEIASLAYKVSKSKTVIDNAGKELVMEWKNKAKAIDLSRNQAREFLDDLRDKVRQPLTDWENTEQERIERERIAKEIELAHDEALQLNELFDKQKALDEQERLLREQQEAAKRKEEEAKRIAEQQERERQLQEQAAEQARLEAGYEAQRKIDKARRLEAEAKAKAEQAERERIEAAEKARIEKENAIREAQEQARLEAARLEQERIAKKIEAKRQDEARKADIAHKSAIDSEVLNCLINEGLDVKRAMDIIAWIAAGKITHVSINY